MSTSTFEVWVKAGCDGVRMAADPTTQQIFMILLLKTEGNEAAVRFNVKTTNLARPHADFKAAGLKHLPALNHGEEIVEREDDIIEYIDCVAPQPTLQYLDTSADRACADLFSKFCFFIKDVNKDPRGLDAELRKIDSHLRESGNEFLCATAMTHLDCRILPKLHHIRLASRAFKQHDSMPVELVALRKYMSRAYESEIFRKSCPCDQEVLLYWADRPDTAKLANNKRAQLLKQTPTYSFDIQHDACPCGLDK